MILTDLKEASSAFNLVKEEEKINIRLIDYGKLYNANSGKVVVLANILQDKKLKDSMEKDFENLFTLKYKVDSLEQLKEVQEKGIGSLKPYLESDP